MGLADARKSEQGGKSFFKSHKRFFGDFGFGASS
jgi:hypothetical protein